MRQSPLALLHQLEEGKLDHKTTAPAVEPAGMVRFEDVVPLNAERVRAMFKR